MPTYNFKCKECDNIDEVNISIKDINDFKNMCSKCNGISIKTFTMSDNMFILKGSEFPGKNLREKVYREKRNKVLDRKMFENHEIKKLVPNVNGEICSTWEDASKLAKESNLNTTGYEKMSRVSKTENNRNTKYVAEKKVF